MRVNEASTILAVFWACVWLSSDNEKHTVKNIRDRIGGKDVASKLIDEDSITKKLDYLERHKAIVFDYGKGRRRGRHPIAKLLNPYEIPLQVRTSKPGRTTLHEWGKRLDEKNELLNNKSFTLWKDGRRVLNAAAFNEKMTAPLQNIVKLATPIGHFVFNTQSSQELDFNWIMKGLDGTPIDLDDKGVKSFYRYILLQFMFTYPHNWKNAPYLAQMERTKEMFRRSVSFIYPHLYAEIALDRKAITLYRIGA